MKTRFVKTQFAVVALALSSAAAFAQESQGNLGSERFDALDTDKSDGINPEEAQASPAVTQAFARADVNRDGILTREEFAAAFRVKRADAGTEPRSPPPPK